MFYASSCPGGSLCRRISAGHPSLHLTIMVSMHQGIEALRIGIVEASMRHRRDRSEHGLNPPIWEPRNPLKSQPSSEGGFLVLGPFLVVMVGSSAHKMCAPEEPCVDPFGRGLEACFGPKPIFMNLLFSWDSGGL